MIDEHPGNGNRTYHLAHPYPYNEDRSIFASCDAHERVSEVLGTDGNPLIIVERKQPVGFLLRPSNSKTP